MKSTALVVLMGAVVSTAAARTLYAVAEPNACVQADYRAVCPVTWPDPNAADGVVLGPVPGDPNIWERPAGPYKRAPALVCDPDPNDGVERIECRVGSSPVKIDFTPGAATWSFSTLVPAGNAGYQFAVYDRRGGVRLVWILLRGVPNAEPVVR